MAAHLSQVSVAEFPRPPPRFSGPSLRAAFAPGMDRRPHKSEKPRDSQSHGSSMSPVNFTDLAKAVPFDRRQFAWKMRPCQAERWKFPSRNHLSTIGRGCSKTCRECTTTASFSFNRTSVSCLWDQETGTPPISFEGRTSSRLSKGKLSSIAVILTAIRKRNR
jgi:hypothetical protein